MPENNPQNPNIPPFPGAPGPQAQPAGDSFITTDVPSAEDVRKAVAAKRVFFVVLGLIVVVIGLLVWELADLIL